MNKRHYEHTLPNIRGSLSNTYFSKEDARFFKKGYMLFQKRVQAKITEQKV